MKLSEHFNSDEFACHCCGQGGEETNPVLIRLLEKLRVDCGDYPLIISSGYRCPRHNFEVGGVVNSQHLIHNAADIVCPKELPYGEFLRHCRYCCIFDYDNNTLMFDGVGAYPDSKFVHVDVRYDGFGPRVEW